MLYCKSFSLEVVYLPDSLDGNHYALVMSGTSLVTNYAVVGLLANISHSAALDGESTASPERKAEMVYG